MKTLLLSLFALLTLTVNAQTCPQPLPYDDPTPSYQCDNNACTQGWAWVAWNQNGQGYPSTYIVYYRPADSKAKPKTAQVNSSNSPTGASACWLKGLKTNTTYQWYVVNTSCGLPGTQSFTFEFTTPDNFNQ